MTAISVIVMAAGKGTRLRSQVPKVLHRLFGKPLLQRVLENAACLPVQQACVIVGHGREQVGEALGQWTLGFPVRTVVQEPQLGTGHAVQQVKNADVLSGDETVLILSGDVPLLQPVSLEQLVLSHQRNGHDLSLLVTDLDNPHGYGRVLCDVQGAVGRIVEEKDASADEKAVRTVNTGIYVLNWGKIAPLLDELSSNNAQGEFYLTDIVALAVAHGFIVRPVALGDPQEMLGVNSRADLARCHQVLNRRTCERLMAEGVTVLSPEATLVAPEVSIGADSVLYPGCVLEGDITIGADCAIGPNTTMFGQVRIADRVTVQHSVVRDTTIGEDCWVGPFAHLRDGVVLSHHIKIGNFVEVKNTTVDHHSNAAHLSYLGDAELGVDVNIGAGVITANYDPVRDLKERTIFADGVKVGCNSVLIAPVTVGEQASVAAGSVITKDVTPWSLAIARQRQSELVDWVKKVKRQLADGNKLPS